jgi:hypothetical protein
VDFMNHRGGSGWLRPFFLRPAGGGGLAEIERGERTPIEEIERELPSWVIK